MAQRRAKRHLPKSVYSALVAGSEAGVTLADNLAAFRELGFAPHVGGAPAQRDMTTTVMGQQVSLPVLISPTGVQSVHPDGELAVARAAAARGTAMGLSSFAQSRSRRWSRPTRRRSSSSTGRARASRSRRGSTAPARPVRAA